MRKFEAAIACALIAAALWALGKAVVTLFDIAEVMYE